MNTLFLDVESAKGCLPPNVAHRIPGIEYAASWPDEAARGFAGMGLACAVTQDVDGVSGRYELDRPAHRQWLQSDVDTAERVWAFGGESFDFVILRTNGFVIEQSKCLDLRVKIREALGVKPDERSGISLDGLAVANGFECKSEDSGAMAPVLWQRGERERVLAGCSRDTTILRLCVARIERDGGLWVPGEAGKKWLVMEAERNG